MKTHRYFLTALICVSTLIWRTSAQAPAAGDTLAEAAAMQSETRFANLVRVVNLHGTCEVLNPDRGNFESAQHNKTYPLGSTFRTAAASSMFLVFSEEDSVELLEQSEVVVTGVCKDNRTCQSLTLQLVRGTVKTTLRENLKGSEFNVNTPNAELKSISGRGEYTISSEGENEIFQAATITGSAVVEGPHYTIPSLQAANTVNIMSAPNRSFSRLTSVSGDFTIELENGSGQPVNFGMSPQALVKIWRKQAPVGGRTVVSTLVVSPTGMARHRFAYVEGRAALQTGELVEAPETMEDLPELELRSEQNQTKPDEEEAPVGL